MKQLARYVVVALLAIVGFAYYQYAYPTLSSEDQFEWNLLTNSVHDLEHPTEANAFIREMECQNFYERAHRYRKIKRWFVEERVRQYENACARTAPRLGESP